MLKGIFIWSLLLLFSLNIVIGQSRNTIDYINASQKIITEYTKSDDWKNFYQLDTLNVSFNEYLGGKYTKTYQYIKDSILDFKPNKTIISYKFSLKKKYRTDCFESSIYLILELDEKMELVNLGELKKIPPFILEKKKNNFIDRDKTKELATKYGLEKGLDVWSLCINWNDELKKMTWVVTSKLTNDNDARGVTYRELEIDAITGKLLSEYYISKNEKIKMH